jgi:transposase
MFEPAGMDCCSGKKLAELNVLIKYLNNKSICPLCQAKNKTTNNIIKEGQAIECVKTSVETFRKRLEITYEKMS